MKNFSVNLNNQAASPGEKLIKYNYIGGIYAFIIFVASVIGTASLICGAITAANWGTALFSPQPLFLVLFLCLFVVCAVIIILFSIKQAKNTNKGFEIYDDKVLFLDGISAKKPYSKRSVIFAAICSVLIPVYNIYWCCKMVYNIRLLTKNTRSMVGECICLVFVPIYNYYWVYTRSRQLKEEFFKRGLECTYTPGLLLFFEFISPIIPLAIMQHHINFLPDERVLTDEEYAKHVEDNTYSFNRIDKVYATSKDFVVESKGSTRTVMLTSRDFRRNLNKLLAYNA